MPSIKLPIQTQKPERRNIYNIVSAEGKLEAQGTSKIGSLITGTVEKIFVVENQVVKKGDLLAILDNGAGGDSIVRQKKALLKQAKATWAYVSSNFKRQHCLYKAGQLSKDFFEEKTREYVFAQADLENKQASYDQELYQYKQTKIVAPHDGVILSIPVKVGQTVSFLVSPPTVLFEIAKDLGTMNVILSVDEGKIGDVVVGQKAKITVDTYPYRTWKGEIISIGIAPSVTDISLSTQKQSICYKTELILKNPENSLRPGMTVHAKIMVGKAKNALVLPGYVFQISAKTITLVAKAIGYSVKGLEEAQKKEIAKKQSGYPCKLLWTLEGNVFVEKAVHIGVSDNAYFEICSGITEDSDVVCDIEDTDEMKALMKTLFGEGL